MIYILQAIIFIKNHQDRAENRSLINKYANIYTNIIKLKNNLINITEINYAHEILCNAANDSLFDFSNLTSYLTIIRKNKDVINPLNRVTHGIANNKR